jgi:hypothetical protein
VDFEFSDEQKTFAATVEAFIARGGLGLPKNF